MRQDRTIVTIRADLLTVVLRNVTEETVVLQLWVLRLPQVVVTLLGMLLVQFTFSFSQTPKVKINGRDFTICFGPQQKFL